MGNSESVAVCTGCLARTGGEGEDGHHSRPSTCGRPHAHSRDANTLSTSGNIGNFIIDSTCDINDDFDLERPPLGHGSFGAVFRATEKATGAVRAVKSIAQKSIPNIEVYENEMKLMARLSHPGIIKLMGSYRDASNFYLVMELCAGGDLFDAIAEAETFTEKTAACVMKQILSAVYYLHEQHIVHRDLKPENFMFQTAEPLETNVLKIIDFGLSCEVLPGNTVSAKCGTPFYVAPEVLSGKYAHKVDEWSCGIIMYVFLVGYPPFNAPSETDVLALVKVGRFDYDPEDWEGISADAKDLINSLLKHSPEDRMSAAEAVSHVWVRDLAPKSEHLCLQSNIVDQLDNFRSSNKLKKAALHVIARQWNDTKVSSLRATFMSLDADGDGTLSMEELRQGIESIGHEEFPGDIEEILQGLDQDHSGSIDYNEFLASTLSQKEYLEEDLCKAAFRVFDVTGSGKITIDELKLVLSSPMMNPADRPKKDEYDELMNEVDENGDGEIDFDEFMKMMRRPATTSRGNRGKPNAGSNAMSPDETGVTTCLTPRLVKERDSN